MPIVRRTFVAATLLLGLLTAPARADELGAGEVQRVVGPPRAEAPPRVPGKGGAVQVPGPLEFPSTLTLAEAVHVFRARGLDLLIAEAAKRKAEGDVLSASAFKNPTASLLVGPTFNYSKHPADGSPCAGCTETSLQYGMNDGAFVFDVLSGKRGLRVRAAVEALSSAKAQRADVERKLVSQVKQAYVQVVLARAAADFAVATQARLDALLVLTRARYPAVINEGDLARIETQKLEGDQGVTRAQMQLRQARVALAVLLGARERVPDFDVDQGWLTLRVAEGFDGKDEDALIKAALVRRPDVFAAGATLRSASATLESAKRQRLPDIALQFQVEGIGCGANAASPCVLQAGASAALPFSTSSRERFAAPRPASVAPDSPSRRYRHRRPPTSAPPSSATPPRVAFSSACSRRSCRGRRWRVTSSSSSSAPARRR